MPSISSHTRRTGRRFIGNRAAQQRDPPPLRRRRHLPSRPPIVRLVGALLGEQHDEWVVPRRYMSAAIAETLALPQHQAEEVIAIEAAAWSSGEDGVPALIHHLDGTDR